MGRYCLKANCLTTIRLLAALQVVYIHSVAHLHIRMPDMLAPVMSFFHGVPIFFTLSGFLVWMSAGRSNTFMQYAKKRFWRIYPELWVAVGVEALALLFLFDGSVKWLDFLAFLFGQGTILQFWTPDFLRSYGCGVPNGALWTICVLIQWYFCAYFAYCIMHGVSLCKWICAICFAIIAGVLFRCFSSETILFKLLENSVLPYFWMFLVGCFVAEYRDTMVPWAVRLWPLVLILIIAINVTGVDLMSLKYGIGGTVLLFMFCIGIGYAFPFADIKTDISYGIYIYHMTIMNALIELNAGSSIFIFVILLLVTCAISYVSTKTIGTFSVKKKQAMSAN